MRLPLSLSLSHTLPVSLPYGILSSSYSEEAVKCNLHPLIWVWVCELFDRYISTQKKSVLLFITLHQAAGWPITTLINYVKGQFQSKLTKQHYWEQLSVCWKDWHCILTKKKHPSQNLSTHTISDIILIQMLTRIVTHSLSHGLTCTRLTHSHTHTHTHTHTSNRATDYCSFRANGSLCHSIMRSFLPTQEMSFQPLRAHWHLDGFEMARRPHTPLVVFANFSQVTVISQHSRLQAVQKAPNTECGK